MLWYYVILFFTSLLSAVFSWLPKVDTLPHVFGIDIDAEMLAAVGYLHTITSVFWVLGDVFAGALLILGYHAIKMVLRFILGSRAP